ncbi:1485_t:CDS:1 [Funneliformis geosporum]|uniref:1485_t:CDS:1 n=1 Tax=Funneliformis geosporum TaxID=1117311 RepID=A0A9W4WNX5_9GLOM|nr:1485_t:CDS:1 [Funneliformis geosporum]
MNTLFTTITKTAPIILIYIFTHTVVILVKNMELKIGAGLLPASRFWALPVIFLVIFLFNFFSVNVGGAFFKIMAKHLKSLSTNTLAYSVTVGFMARFLAYGVSPLSGNLQMSLTATKLSYKDYIKKT